MRIPFLSRGKTVRVALDLGNNPQGAYTEIFNKWVPRSIDGQFNEAMREGIPLIDAAIDRLTNLDGRVRIASNNEAFAREINDWLDDIEVFPTGSEGSITLARGIHAFDQAMSAEIHEQGFAVSEFVANRRRDDIRALTVADSKRIRFEQESAGLVITHQRPNTGQFTRLNPQNKMFAAFNFENGGNPYGISLLRSTEISAKVYFTMMNALGKTWERFGNPIFFAKLKSNDKENIGNNVKAIQSDIAAAMKAKAEGSSADVVYGVPVNGDLTIEVLGAKGHRMEIQSDGRYIAEQLLAKTGLPGWMFGLSWTQSYNMSDQQAEAITWDIKARQLAKNHIYKRLVNERLAIQGRTMKPGSWWVEWEQVNLHDMLKLEQAGFMRAQGRAVLANVGLEPDGEKMPERITMKSPGCACGCGSTKAVTAAKGEDRPEAMPALDAVAATFEGELKSAWSDLESTVFRIMDLPVSKSADGEDETVELTTDRQVEILLAADAMVAKMNPEYEASPIRNASVAAVKIGTGKALEEIAESVAVTPEAVVNRLVKQMGERGLKAVTGVTTEFVKVKALSVLQEMSLAGESPLTAASRLRAVFKSAEYRWTRIALTETQVAAQTAKKEEAKARGLKMRFRRAPGQPCPVCDPLVGVHDPGDAPVPGEDTHPECLCDTMLVRE